MYFKKFYLASFLFVGSVNSINDYEIAGLLRAFFGLIQNDFKQVYINSGSEEEILMKKGLIYLFFINFDQNIREHLYKNEKEKKQPSEENFKLRILSNLFKTEDQSDQEAEQNYLKDVDKIFDEWMFDGVFERIISLYLSIWVPSGPNQKWDCNIKLDGKFIKSITYTVKENKKEFILSDNNKKIIEEKIKEICSINISNNMWSELIKIAIKIYQEITTVKEKGEVIKLTLSHLLINYKDNLFLPEISFCPDIFQIPNLEKIMEECAEKPIDNSSLFSLILTILKPFCQKNFKPMDVISLMNEYGPVILSQFQKNLSFVEEVSSLLEPKVAKFFDERISFFVKEANPFIEQVGERCIDKILDNKLVSQFLNSSKDSDSPLSGIYSLSNFVKTLCFSGNICYSIFNDNVSLGWGANSNIKGDLSLDIFIGWRGNQDRFPLLKKCFLNSIIINFDHTIGTKFSPTNLSILFVPNLSKANLYFFIGFKILLENAKKSGLNLGIIVIL